jgi:Holliday junction resolvase RusA-like endonuclease
MNYTWNITPMGAPRLNRFDAWKKRPRVLRYFAFRDAVAVEMKRSETDWKNVDSLAVTFYIPMANSWSKKKKITMDGQPHKQKPDIDNLVKALLDSMFRGGDDCGVYNIRASKFWALEGRMEIAI